MSNELDNLLQSVLGEKPDPYNWNENIEPTVPTPLMDIAKAFWDEVAPGQPIRLRYLHDNPKASVEKEYPSVEIAWPAVTKAQSEGWNVYYFPNEMDVNHIEEMQGRKYATDLNLQAVRALFLDFDDGLPTQWHVPPNIIVNTSQKNGVQRGQPLWLINYPRKCENRDSPNYKDGFRRDEQHLRAAYPTSDPSCVNASRILRLPGTLHLKDLSNPQLVTFQIVRRDPDPQPGFAPIARRRKIGDILGGIPQPETLEREKPERSTDEPVDLYQLREALSWIDPGCDRATWRDVIFGLGTTTLVTGIPIWGEGRENDRDVLKDLSIEWSQGKLFRGTNGKNPYEDELPAEYTNEKDILKIYCNKAADRPSKITARTIFKLAQLSGMSSPGETKARVARAKFEFRWPADFANEPEPEYWDTDQMIPHIPHEGCVGIVFAAWGQLKTALALRVLLDIALGDKHGKIVYAAGEGSYGVGRQRLPAYCRKMGVDINELTGKFAVVSAVPLLQMPFDVDTFIENLKQLPWPPDILAVDTLATATAGLDENGSLMSAVLTGNGAVGRIQRAFPGMTILFIAHEGKDPKRGIRGHSGLDGNISFSIQVKANKKLGLLELRVRKMKDGPDDVSTFWSYELNGVPVPERMTKAEFKAARGVPMDEESSEEKAKTGAEELRQFANKMISKHGWTTWDRGKTHADLADLKMKADEWLEPPAIRRSEHEAWSRAKDAYADQFKNASRGKRAEPFGSIQSKSWRWHDNLNWPATRKE